MKQSVEEKGILTSAQRKLNTTSKFDSARKKGYAPTFDSQFEMDLFSSAKSYRKKSCFGGGQSKEN